MNKKIILVFGLVSMFLLAGITTIPVIGVKTTQSIVAGQAVDVYPGDSIQEALDQAGNWGNVNVHPGTYTENIRIKYSYVNLKSVEGPETTILKGLGDDNVVTITGGWALLKGFTIMNSGNSYSGVSTAFCTDVKDCILKDNDIGVFIPEGSTFGVVYHCSFINNNQNAFDSMPYGYGSMWGCNYWDDYEEKNPGIEIVNGLWRLGYKVGESNWDFYPAVNSGDWPNIPPHPADIGIWQPGALRGMPLVPYPYFFDTVDLDGDDYYIKIDWGDGKVEEWEGPYEEDYFIEKIHVWKKGKFSLKVYVKDENEFEGWYYSSIDIKMGIILSKSTTLLAQNPIFKFLESNPNAFPLLRRILGLDNDIDKTTDLSIGIST